MGRIDLAPEIFCEIKAELEEIVRIQVGSAIEAKQKQFDEETRKMKESFEDRLKQLKKRQKRDINHLKKSIGSIEKEAEIQAETLVLELTKIKEWNMLLEQNIASLKADVQPPKTASTANEVETAMKLIDSFNLEFRKSVTENQKFEKKNTKKLKDLESEVEANVADMEALLTEFDSLKCDLKKLEDFYKTSKQEMQAEFFKCRSNHEQLSRTAVSQKLEIKDFQQKLSDELESLQLDELSYSAIRHLYKHFPSGMCYSVETIEEKKYNFKKLICTRIKKNYTKRIPYMNPSKLNTPFDVSIGRETFRVTEYYTLSTVDQIEDTYYVVPKLFGGYFQICGCEFLKKFSHKIKIYEDEICYNTWYSAHLYEHI